MTVGAQLELLPLVSPRPCEHCGTVFEAGVRKRGRPIAFCSDGCRRAHAGAQKRAWSKRHTKSLRDVRARRDHA